MTAPLPNERLSQNTFWNGEPCEAETVKVRCLLQEYGDGYNMTREFDHVTAIRIKQNDKTFYLEYFDAWWWLYRQDPVNAPRSWWQRLWNLHSTAPRILANVCGEIRVPKKYKDEA